MENSLELIASIVYPFSHDDIGCLFTIDAFLFVPAVFFFGCCCCYNRQAIECWLAPALASLWFCCSEVVPFRVGVAYAATYVFYRVAAHFSIEL